MPLLLPGPRKKPRKQDVMQFEPIHHELAPLSIRCYEQAMLTQIQEPGYTEVVTPVLQPDQANLDLHNPVESQDDGNGYDYDHDSLFDGSSDTSECAIPSKVNSGMATQGPYYDNAGPVDLPAMVDMALNDYDHASETPSRYPEPSYQPGPLAHLHATADLHNLVAAAHSVAEQEQNQHRHEAERPDMRPFLGGAKRKSPANGRASRAKRQKQDPTEAADVAAESVEDVTTEVLAPDAPGATTLYRPVTEKTKNWTRPPMHTLFNSFRLSAQHFLIFQEAAKVYMLDPNHPDRIKLSGSRGRGDSRNVKLALLHEADQFLEEGAGAKFFPVQPKDTKPGEAEAVVEEQKTKPPAATETAPASDAPNVDPAIAADEAEDNNDTAEEETDDQPYEWPQDREKLVALCIPLLRKMVTNEKQRKYAEKTRRVNKQARAASSQPTIAVHAFIMTTDEHQEPVVLKQLHGQLPSEDDAATEGRNQWETLLALLASHAHSKDIQVQTPNGLMIVHDQHSLSQAVQEVLRAPWLDRIVRVVVQGPSPEEETEQGAGSAA